LAQHDFADKLVSQFEAQLVEEKAQMESLLQEKAQLVEDKAQLVDEIDSLERGSLFKIDIKATNLIL
jgi:hypothetical protein